MKRKKNFVKMFGELTLLMEGLRVVALWCLTLDATGVLAFIRPAVPLIIGLVP